MSNRSKRGGNTPRKVVTQEVHVRIAPSPVGPGFQKGQNAARQILSETSWDEWADLLAGFKSMALAELNERKAKVTESAKHLDEAFKALNS
jgi:hypothetical protein